MPVHTYTLSTMECGERNVQNVSRICIWTNHIQDISNDVDFCPLLSDKTIGNLNVTIMGILDDFEIFYITI